MASEEAEKIRAELFALPDKSSLTLEERRANWAAEAAEAPLPEGTVIEPADMAGVFSEWIRHRDVAGEGVFVLLHGGGFVNGGGATHYGLASRLSKVTGMKVLLPDYRLAPEQPYPAAVIDAVAVYGAILASGVPAEKIVVGGDSAGGGLTLQMLLALREADAPLPLAALLLSPWTDLTQSGGSYDRNAARDPIIEKDRLTEAARQYAGDLDLASPLLSTVNAELGGLPPMLIHAGGHEVMLDDSTMFAERARAAGVEVLLEVWPEMWHVWHQWAPDCPEANDAIDKIGAFVKAQVRADDGS